MAAPCFFAPRCLAADLSTLGFPDAEDPEAVAHNGKARLGTLSWLARVIDPSCDAGDEEKLAAFWDKLGLHSASKNNRGHRVPLTVEGDKQRERHAAGLYLRTAIDLAMAFQRRRQRHCPEDAKDDALQSGEDDEGPVFDDEDVLAMSQLDNLIRQRHIFFPSTIGLFNQPAPRKRRPLAQRKNTMTNFQKTRVGPQSSRSEVSAQGKESSRKPKTREELLERLRVIHRETQDLEHMKNATKLTDVSKGDVDLSDEFADLDDEAIQRFAQASEELAQLVEGFKKLAEDSFPAHGQTEELSERDPDADMRLSRIAGECADLEKEITLVLNTAESIQTSVSKLERGKRLLESVQNSSAMRTVAEHSRRLDRQQ